MNQPVEITATVIPPLNVSDSTVEILLPEGFELVSGNLKWQGYLKENEAVQIEGTIKAVKTGTWAIQFLATANPPTGFNALETKFLYVSVSDNTAEVNDTPLPGINYIGPKQTDSIKTETTKID